VISISELTTNNRCVSRSTTGFQTEMSGSVLGCYLAARVDV